MAGHALTDWMARFPPGGTLYGGQSITVSVAGGNYVCTSGFNQQDMDGYPRALTRPVGDHDHRGGPQAAAGQRRVEDIGQRARVPELMVSCEGWGHETQCRATARPCVFHCLH
jgi:hypothetical protein